VVTNALAGDKQQFGTQLRAVRQVHHYQREGHAPLRKQNRIFFTPVPQYHPDVNFTNFLAQKLISFYANQYLWF
jgi:hypothetical protein